MITPVRIQRRRAKGWRMQDASPNGLPVVYVGRPTIWGNPFVVGAPCGVYPEGMGWGGKAETMIECLSLDESIVFYRNAARGFLMPEMYPFGHDWCKRQKAHFGGQYFSDAINHHLRNKNLACWCPLDRACHADVLLAIANMEIAA